MSVSTGVLVWLQIGNRCQDKDVSRDAKQIPRQRRARKNTGQSTSAAHLHTVLLSCHQEKRDGRNYQFMYLLTNQMVSRSELSHSSERVWVSYD